MAAWGANRFEEALAIPVEAESTDDAHEGGTVSAVGYASWDGEKLYNNKSDEYKSVWDYECNKTQRIKIFVKVPLVSKENAEPKRGCVTILSGIKGS